MVRYAGAYETRFGPPNDAALRGHPLASRGVGPYAAFRVHNSTRIRELERRNSVHEHYRPEAFERYQHIVMTFHDSTLDVIAEGLSSEVVPGPMRRVLERAAREADPDA